MGPREEFRGGFEGILGSVAVLQCCIQDRETLRVVIRYKMIGLSGRDCRGVFSASVLGFQAAMASVLDVLNSPIITPSLPPHLLTFNALRLPRVFLKARERKGSP